MHQSSTKILTVEEILPKLVQWRLKDAKVVFTNGCFDILHKGHTDYLESAANLGTHLVIGLNSDSSVRTIKGEGRPVQDEESRAHVLAGLQYVAAVILFDEDTPINLIKAVRPEVLVKGDDYTVEEIAGHEFVRSYDGEVTTISLTEGYSTSGLIEKINVAIRTSMNIYRCT